MDDRVNAWTGTEGLLRPLRLVLDVCRFAPLTACNRQNDALHADTRLDSCLLQDRRSHIQRLRDLLAAFALRTLRIDPDERHASR